MVESGSVCVFRFLEGGALSVCSLYQSQYSSGRVLDILIRFTVDGPNSSHVSIAKSL